jgi:sigma-E factor negative regulatory protein RseA
MNDRISALMDGEVDEKSAARLIEALARDAQAIRTWRSYHLIGDAMRGGMMRGVFLSERFTERVAQRLAAEPTVLAPRRMRSESPRLFTMSALAASVAAVAFVGWMAFAPQPQLAPAPMAQVHNAADKPVLVPLPSAANDYLLAHQGFSPRVSLQGMAPYVLTIAEHPADARKPEASR